MGVEPGELLFVETAADGHKEQRVRETNKALTAALVMSSEMQQAPTFDGST